MKARIFPDAEGEQWLVADDDEPYVDGPFVEIPDDIGQAMRDVQNRWAVASKAFTEWVESEIDAKGEDYRDYLTGTITESQYQARRDGCTHSNAQSTEGRFPHIECLDCGRRQYPERWI